MSGAIRISPKISLKPGIPSAALDFEPGLRLRAEGPPPPAPRPYLLRSCRLPAKPHGLTTERDRDPSLFLSLSYLTTQTAQMD